MTTERNEVKVSGIQQPLWLAFSIAAPLAVAAIELITERRALLTLAALGPLMASMRLSWRATLAVACLSLATVEVVALVGGFAGDANQLIRSTIVVILGALAVAIARLRSRVEEMHSSAERARTLSDLLAQESATMASGFDSPGALRDVIRLCVPTLGDHASLHVLGRDGAITTYSSSRNNEVVTRLDERRANASNSHPDPVVRAIDSRELVSISHAKTHGLRSRVHRGRQTESETDEHAGSMVVVPLIARGRVVGAITLESNKHQVANETLIRGFTSRIAVELDNRLLYEEQREIANQLQQALLPPALPRISGLEVAAAFRPAGTGGDVGGDFYDLFPVAGGWAVVIGDVSGKGAQAAALTGLVRHTMRGAANSEHTPTDVLEAVNEAMREERIGSRFCTAIYGLLRETKSGFSVQFACAGHPLPLHMSSDGTVLEVGEAGTLLGIWPDPELVEVEAELRPGDSLTLFTDGLTDAAHPKVLGAKALSHLLSSGAEQSANQLATRLEQAVLAQTPIPSDDVAIMVLRTKDSSSDTPSVRLAA